MAPEIAISDQRLSLAKVDFAREWPALTLTNRARYADVGLIVS